MNETILAVFANQSDAEDALRELMTTGYRTEDFSIITRDGAQQVTSTPADKAAGGLASGAVTGGAIGAVAGLLVGIGAITIPGIGAILIGGPIAAALGLTGAAAATATGAMTGALAGGIVGALVGLGVPEDTAKYYEKRIGEGGILLAISASHTSDADARTILEQHDAEEITTVAK